MTGEDDSSDGSDNSQSGSNNSAPSTDEGSNSADTSTNPPPSSSDDSGDENQNNNNQPAPVATIAQVIPPSPKTVPIPPVTTTLKIRTTSTTTTTTISAQATSTIISMINTDQNIPAQQNSPAQVIIKANNLPDASTATDAAQASIVSVVQANYTTTTTAYVQPTTVPQSSTSSTSKTSSGLPKPVTIVAFIIGGVFASCIALFLGVHLKKYGHLNFLQKYYPQDPTSSEKDLTIQSMEEPIDIISDPSDKVPFERREEINRYSEQDMDESFPAFPATALTAAEPDLPAPRMSYLITPSSRTSTLPYSGRDSKLTFTRSSTQERDPKLRSLRTSLGQRQSVQSSMGRKSKFMVDSVIPEDYSGQETPSLESSAKPYRISMFNSRFSRFSFRNSKYTSGTISEGNTNGNRESTVSVDSEESLSNYL
ncbi:hypothetical protein HK103_006419 [Boothiomyces macroporosus]|uniref:Uncharacterized protein n=1 Tax=Boothiomyces macroporosus TaxID=261099 RepID=A0AAD5UL14_9FUNG|nr:hypothetical protein HK103_006419 [Boothiomyces macroporosus]